MPAHRGNLGHFAIDTHMQLLLYMGGGGVLETPAESAAAQINIGPDP